MTSSREWPRRVLVLADQFGHSEGRVHGVSTYFATHLPPLSEAVDLDVCFLGRTHPAAAGLGSSGVPLRFFGRSKWDPRSFWDVARRVRSFGPDLIHLHGEKSFIIGSLAARARGVPSVMHLHDGIRLRPPLRPLQRRLSGIVHRALVVSEQGRAHATDEYGFAPEKVRVLNYGVDLRSFAETPPEARSRFRREFQLTDDTPLVGVVGRVNEDKGQLQAIEAMAQVALARPEARLLIVGDGPGRSECEAAVAARGLSGRVIFTGQRKDIPAVFAALDVVLVPSMWDEGLPFVSLEAIAAGRPVVAFDSGGLRNSVVHDLTGILLGRGDVDGLARETLALIGDAERRSRYGEAGREHARRFSVSGNVLSLLEVYRELPRAS